MQQKTIEELKEYWQKVQEMQAIWRGSWPWEWYVFQRRLTHLIN